MEEVVDWLGYWAVRGFAGLVRLLPRQAAYSLGRFAARLYFPFSERRRSAYADLKAAFGPRYTPEERWKIVLRHYEHIGQSFMEMIHFAEINAGNIQKEFDIPEMRYADEADAAGAGLIYLTAHLGNWELLVTLADIYGKPMHALSRIQKFSRLYSLLNEFRIRRGSKVVGKGMGIRDLLKALKNGERIGVLGDQSAGKHQGLILPFFGRKTTVPTGAFELAARTGAMILPSFVVRLPEGRHRVYLNKPFTCQSLPADQYLEQVRDYLKTLEDLVSRYPEQWLWAKKRWKYTWTKRLLILSDGKAGHVKQSHAVAQTFYSITEQYGRPGMEYPTQTIEVKYRSRFHRILFAVFAFFMHPWAQGRLGAWARWFFTHDTAKALGEAACDFVISTGSALTPVNLCVAVENAAKSIVCMSPPFPYHFLRYNLAIVPAHDDGRIPKESLRMLLTPSASLDHEVDAEDLRSEISRDAKVCVCVLLGGASRNYSIKEDAARTLMDTLERRTVDFGDYIITTSRRTPEEVTDYLENSRRDHPGCRLLVVATKDTRKGVVEAMLDLSEIAIVTEDSISMVSEAVRAGKKVIALAVDDSSALPKKHQRFLSGLEASGAVLRARAGELEAALEKISGRLPDNLAQQEEDLLRRRLQEIL